MHIEAPAFTKQGAQVDTYRIKETCRAIIKLCDHEPHAVDSLLEEAYLALVDVELKMKGSADRAAAERDRFDKALQNGRAERQRIPSLVRRFPSGFSMTAVEKLLDSMSDEELAILTANVANRKAAILEVYGDE